MRIIALLALCFCAVGYAGEVVTNRLAVHLLDENLSRDTLRIEKPDALRLVSPPILSDADFVRYDTATHVFAITAESAKRLSIKLTGLVGPARRPAEDTGYLLNWRDTPFVLVADGEPIYLGMFSTPNSSTIYSRSPTVFPIEMFVPSDSTNSVKLKIELVRLGQNEEGPETDLRNDKRILEAIKKLRLKP
jgi:hypothetical protein